MMLPDRTLPLIAELKNIPESATEKVISEPVRSLSDVLDKMLQTKYHRNAKTVVLEKLQNHWHDWFLGTDFSIGFPERIDRWACLWIKVPNPILCQNLQFKSAVLLKTLDSFSGGVIKHIRWFV